MNFFAHYYFDRIGHSAWNTGLVLPDLVKNFTGRRMNVEDYFRHADEQEETLLLEGSLKHIERDKMFHGSDFFRKTEEDLKQMLRQSGAWGTVPRTWFIAHLMVELLLDGVLIENNEELLNRFYQDLDDGLHPVALPLLRSDEQFPHEDFSSRSKRFLESRYLYSYTDDSRLSFALNMISKRAGVSGDWDEDQKQRISAVVADARALVNENLRLLLQELGTASSGGTY